MEFLSLAKQRCSVRKYKTDEIEKEKLDKILEAARIAPKIKQLNDINWIEIGFKEGDTFSVYGKEYAIDSSGHINVSAEDEFTSTEIKYPSRSI